jgi:hypothetical protein
LLDLCLSNSLFLGAIQLIFDLTGIKPVQWRKCSLFSDDCYGDWIYTQKRASARAELESIRTPHQPNPLYLTSPGQTATGLAAWIQILALPFSICATKTNSPILPASVSSEANSRQEQSYVVSVALILPDA